MPITDSLHDTPMAGPDETAESRQRELYDELREKLAALYRRDQDDIHGKILVFHEYLKCKYPDSRERRLFHLLSGSTPRGEYHLFDFPEPDSIETFIDTEFRRIPSPPGA